jgi:hypothetical protein
MRVRFKLLQSVVLEYDHLNNDSGFTDWTATSFIMNCPYVVRKISFRTSDWKECDKGYLLHMTSSTYSALYKFDRQIQKQSQSCTTLYTECWKIILSSEYVLFLFFPLLLDCCGRSRIVIKNIHFALQVVRSRILPALCV